MIVDKEYKLSTLSTLLIFIILLSVLTFVTSQESKNITIYDQKNEKEKAIISLHQDEQIEYEIERINSDDESIMLIGTLDGYIHAFDSNNNSEKWKIKIGNPLVTSYINKKNFVDSIFLFPGPDGNLYYSNNEENTFQKIDIPLKNLIERSPYTLPNMPNTLFIGNKVTNVFIIDITTGVIVSKITNNNEEDIIHKRPVHSNNLATIIRIDHTLKGIDREKGDQLWNVTTSEIMVLEKGAKHELSYNHALESPKNPQFQKNLLTYQMRKYFQNKNLNSIVNAYKFKSDAPYKIFDNNETLNNNFADYVGNYISPKEESVIYDIFNDFYSWKKEKMNNLTFDQFRKDIYFIDKIKTYHFHLDHANIIFTLIVIIVLLMIFTVRTYIKKQKLKNELKIKNGSNMTSNNDSNSNSTSSTSKDITENKDIGLVTSLANYNGYVKKTNLEGNYYEEPNFEEKALPTLENENTGLNHINNIFLLKNDKPLVMYNWENDDKTEFTKIERTTVVFDKKEVNLSGIMLENTKIIEGADQITKKLEIGVEEKDDKIIITKDIRSKYRKKTTTNLPNCLPSGEVCEMIYSKKNSLNNIETKVRTSSMDINDINPLKLTSIGKYYKEDENVKTSENDSLFKISKKKNRSCSPVQKKNIIIEKTNQVDNDLRYTSDVSSSEELQLNIEETDNLKNLSNKKLIRKSEKFSSDLTDKMLLIQQKQVLLKNTSNQLMNKFDSTEKSNLKITKINEINRDKSHNSKITKNPENSYKSNHSKSHLISFESISNYRIKTINQISIRRGYHEETNKKADDSIIEHSHMNNNSLAETFSIKPPYSKVLRDNIDRLDNGRFKKDFLLYDVLGQGGFGCVQKVKHKLDGSYYAVKKIELEVGVSEYLKDLSVLKEVKTMLKLQHKNVVRYFNCWFESRSNLIELKNNSEKKKSERNINKLKRVTSNLSETVDLISKQSINSSNLGINFEKDKTMNEDNRDHSVIEEEPKEIFSDSEEDKKKVYSIDYEKNSSGEEEKNFSIDDSKLNNKRESKNEGIFNVFFYIQMEYCGNETLHEFLQKRDKPLERKTIFLLFKQIALGVAHIHKNGIIHRDLKPANIFMIGNNKINLKIGDFGLAADVIDSKRSRIELTKNLNFNSTTSLNHEYSVKLSENVGTPLYQSPEQIKNSLYNEKVDIYSLGLILLEICSFFKTYHERKLCLENVREHNIIPEKIKQDYPNESELILAMTAALPSKRPSALSLLKNEFFRKLEEEFDGYNKNK